MTDNFDNELINWTNAQLRSKLDAAIKLIADTYAPGLILSPVSPTDDLFIDRFLDIFDS